MVRSVSALPHGLFWARPSGPLWVFSSGLQAFFWGLLSASVLGELSVRSDVRAAGMAGFGATLGLALGAAAKLAIGFGMIGIFLVVRLF